MYPSGKKKKTLEYDSYTFQSIAFFVTGVLSENWHGSWKESWIIYVSAEQIWRLLSS